MRTVFGSLVLGSMVALAMGSGRVMAAEKPSEVDIDIKALPPAVLETVKERFKDATVVGASQETTAEGKDVYEVSMKRAGKSIDSILTPAGEFVLIEMQVTRKELPEPVATALDTNYPKAKVRLYEEVYEVAEKVEKLAYYEVLLTDKAKQLQAVEFGSDGKILKVEKKNPGEVD
jgi:hypothetical protein